MTKECTLKEMFVVEHLDKIQPGWREGEDVTAATKNAIKTYVLEHYKDVIDLFESPDCITTRSLGGAITRAQGKLNISPKVNRHPRVCVEETSDSSPDTPDTPDEPESVPEADADACSEDGCPVPPSPESAEEPEETAEIDSAELERYVRDWVYSVPIDELGSCTLKDVCTEIQKSGAFSQQKTLGNWHVGKVVIANIEFKLIFYIKPDTAEAVQKQEAPSVR